MPRIQRTLLPAKLCLRIVVQYFALSQRRVSWALNYDDFRRRWSHERKVIRRDLFDPCVRGPGTLFNLQLAPFDIQFVAFVRQCFEFYE